MKTSDAFPSKYLKADDLQGRAVTVIIERYQVVQMPDGARKPALFFRGKEKGMVLNKTNSNRIEHMLGYGSEMDGWIGKQITIHTEMTEFQGKMGPALRVRVGPANDPRPAPLPANTRSPVTEDNFDDEVPF